MQLLIMNKEFLVSSESPPRVDYVFALCTHSRCYYRLNGLVRSLDWYYHGFIDAIAAKKLTKLDHLEEVKVVIRFP